MAEAYDIVVGHRVRRRDPCLRKLNAWGWNTLRRLLFGVLLSDIDCGFKVFHRRVFERMTLQVTGAMIDTEILVQARRAGWYAGTTNRLSGLVPASRRTVAGDTRHPGNRAMCRRYSQARSIR